MDDILPQVQSVVLGNYAQAAVTTLCVADHIEMWPTEFSSIWKTRKTGISVLFLINRYMLLLFVMTQAVSNFSGNGTDEQLTLDIWSSVLEVGVMWNHLIKTIIQLAIPLLALGYDIFIFVSTAVKTVKHSVEMQRLNQSSITQIIIRDAIIATIFQVVSLKSGNAYNFEDFITPFFDILPNLLISRLMLNLHTFSKPRNTMMSQVQQTHVSSLDFASNRMLGSIGAPLDGRSFNEEEEDDGENENRGCW
ncbi:hypothetical protein C8J55DRAFT_486560 [Lentinula edodes]|uniref:DUF6533 domain-containing protein n=1 Tax=Lentinula lateritia TaxID=40482 RepID=A0A9W9ARN0_9AGAR|nr:hypothetical protein C8J55DRAFT_486560 [Lentinula edodes]